MGCLTRYYGEGTLDLSQVKFRGQDPIAYSNETHTVSYLITVDGGKEFTVGQDDFTWPAAQAAGHSSASGSDESTCPWTRTWAYSISWTEDMHWLTWTNFHNATPVLVLIYRLPTDDGMIDWTWVTNELNKKSKNLVAKLVTTQPADWQLGDMTSYKVNGVYQYEGTNYTRMWGMTALSKDSGGAQPLGMGSGWAAWVNTDTVWVHYLAWEQNLPDYVNDVTPPARVANWETVAIMHEMHHAVGLTHPDLL